MPRHLAAWRPSRLRLCAFRPAVNLASIPMQHTIANFPTDYDQGQLGSCGPNSAAEVYEWDQRKQTKFSRLWLYWFVRATEGDVDEDGGIEIPDMMSVLHAMGMPPETEWPYDVGRFRSPPPSSTLMSALRYRLDGWDLVADLDHLLFELANDQPVTFGFQVPASMEDGSGSSTATTGIVDMPSAANPIIGGHCCNFIGYDRARRLIKSTCHYGPQFGDGGCIWIPFEFVTSGLVRDMIAMRSIG